VSGPFQRFPIFVMAGTARRGRVKTPIQDRFKRIGDGPGREPVSAGAVKWGKIAVPDRSGVDVESGCVVMNEIDRDMSEGGSTDPRDERIGSLLNDFFDRRARGEAISEAAFLAEHQEYRDELREHLRGLDLIRDMGSGSAHDPADDRTRPVGGSSAINTLSKSVLPQITGYDVQKQIGRGGMGVVYKAVQKSTSRVVALKVLLEGPFATDIARKRFEREIALAAQLKHPCIIPIFDSGDFDGRLYYAMEHVYGHGLTEYLKVNPINAEAKLRLFARICDAVSHAHQRGVIHRDLKPGNILVDGGGVPHVLDFGLAKAGSLADAQLSMTAQIVGTPAYMSPEQAAGDPGGIDTRSDVYSLGVMLYEMMTGTLPYETNVSIGRVLQNIAHAEPVLPRKVKAEIDTDVEAIILKALEKDREKRYQSVDLLSTDIRNHLSGAPISAVPATGIYLLKKGLKRHRRLVMIVGCLVLAAGVTMGVLRRTIRKEEASRQKVQELTANVVTGEQKLIEEREAAERQRQASAALAQVTDLFVSGAAENLPPEQKKVLAELMRDTASMFGKKDKAAAIPDLLGKFTRALIDAQVSSQAAPTTSDAKPVEAAEKKKQDEVYKRILETMFRAVTTQQMVETQATSSPAIPPEPPGAPSSTQP